jgi:hypothetical protein
MCNCGAKPFFKALLVTDYSYLNLFHGKSFYPMMTTAAGSQDRTEKDRLIGC